MTTNPRKNEKIMDTSEGRSTSPFHLKYLEHVTQLGQDEILKISKPMLEAFLDLDSPELNENGQLILMKHPEVLKMFLSFLTTPSMYNPSSVEVAVKRAYNVLNIIKCKEYHVRQFVETHCDIFMQKLVEVMFSPPQPFYWYPQTLSQLNYNFYHIKDAISVLPEENKIVKRWMLTSAYTSNLSSSPPIYKLLWHIHHQPVIHLILEVLFDKEDKNSFIDLPHHSRLKVGFIELVSLGIFEPNIEFKINNVYYCKDDWVELLSNLIAEATKKPNDPFFDYLYSKHFHLQLYSAMTSGKMEDCRSALTLLLNVDWYICYGLGDVKEPATVLLNRILLTFIESDRGLTQFFAAVYSLDAQPTDSDSNTKKMERVGELLEGPTPFGHSDSDTSWFVPLTLNRLNFMSFFTKRLVDNSILNEHYSPTYPKGLIVLGLEWFLSSSTSTIFRNCYIELVKKIIVGMLTFNVNREVFVFLLVDCRALARSLQVLKLNGVNKDIAPLLVDFNNILMNGYRRLMDLGENLDEEYKRLLVKLNNAYDYQLFTDTFIQVDLDISISDSLSSSMSKIFSSPPPSP